MPRVCTVCRHPQRESIDQALINNEPMRNIAKRFSLSLSSVNRHKEAHLSKAMVQAQGAVEAAHADTLLEQLQNLKASALSIKDKAETAADHKTALRGIHELVGILELLFKLSGELQSGVNAQILIQNQDLLPDDEKQALALYRITRDEMQNMTDAEALAFTLGAQRATKGIYDLIGGALPPGGGD